ncbi:protein disulfide isomerase-like 1-2 [Primulina eburnea]|uniref:protein disulfide isomerase-like 1-2 n=1 Tax=Primulina eburnea TaxID=1245227 RepID=UPI003C6CA532
MALAEKLRSDYWDICSNTDYSIAHTLDAKFLPRGEPVDKPTLRLLKPFDELFVDFQDFKVDAMEKFIGEASIPLVTVRDNDPSNHINKFFESSNAKDATVNDIPSDTFDVQRYPTQYLRSSSGNLLPYDGERTKEDIVDFIQKNRDSHADPISTKSEAVDTDSVKDKL